MKLGSGGSLFPREDARGAAVVASHYMLKPRISALMKGEMGNEVKENPKISLESP